MHDNEREDPVPVLKIQLANLIVRRIAGWTQVNAASLLSTSQPRVSDLRNGRLERFSLEQLVRLVRRVEGFVELRVEWGPRLASFFNPIE
jgi:predicted XRE-type DNA-binding protein